LTDGAKPAHQVTLSYCFWMGRHEVTQAEYQALMGTNPSVYVGANRPVEFVSWFDAQVYCSALTAQYSESGALPSGYQFRLPTEAEWEWACRAGSFTEFHYGNSLTCSMARFQYSYHSNSECYSSSRMSTVPVGSYLPNAWGLYDMHGNVAEWCLDSLAAYSAVAVTDPFVTGGPSRVVRSGSHGGRSDLCRSACRLNSSPGIKYQDVGFRVVLAPVLFP
jgi:formylglycine-generating enzyme required for sulfatase activity